VSPPASPAIVLQLTAAVAGEYVINILIGYLRYTLTTTAAVYTYILSELEVGAGGALPPGWEVAECLGTVMYHHPTERPTPSPEKPPLPLPPSLPPPPPTIVRVTPVRQLPRELSPVVRAVADASARCVCVGVVVDCDR
jgi:hypothetical protein